MFFNRSRLILLLVCCMALLTACRTPPDRFEAAFVEKCAKYGGSTSRCQCEYQAMHAHYGERRMAAFRDGRIPDDFAAVLESVGKTCSSK